MRQKLWLVSEIFFPDIEVATGNIATEIALKFAEDFDVHVICGPKGYEGNKIERKDKNIEAYMKIHRVNKFNFNKNKSLSRIVRFLCISFSMFFKGFKIRKQDKVFVISNPASIIPLFSFLKFIKGFDYVILMHDVFPENLIPAGYLKDSNFLFRITKYLFILSRKAADKIIVLGRDMKDLVCEKLPSNKKGNVLIIPNWADIENIFPMPFKSVGNIEPQKLNDKIVIQFAGNHGILQNLIPFLQLIKEMNNKELYFVFAGGGATKQQMMDYVKDNNMENVSFLPSFSISKLNLYQNACTIGLVSLSDKLYGVGVPSKSYNILAAGKPILFLGNCNTEIALFIKEYDAGWAFEYNNKMEIIDFLNKLSNDKLDQIQEKGNNGRNVVNTYYNKELILQQLRNII